MRNMIKGDLCALCFRVIELTRLPREIIYGSERLQVIFNIFGYISSLSIG